jgi:peptidoglycan/LPS O-acetylase OafA/YrhL
MLPSGGWIAPGWSVSAEMGAYAALPLLILCIKRVPSGRVSFPLVWLVLGIFLCVLAAAGVHDLNVSVRGGLLRLAFEFTAGGLAYHAWRGGLRVPVRSATIAILVLMLAALTLPYPQANFLMLPPFVLTIMLAAQGSGLIVRALTSAPMMFVGRISYSLYLIHWPVLMFWRSASGLPRTLGGFAADAAMVPATLALATILYHAVEAPSHVCARRLSGTSESKFRAVST